MNIDQIIRQSNKTLIGLFLRNMKEKNRSWQTIKSYQADLVKFSLWFESHYHHHLWNATSDIMGVYLSFLMDGGQYLHQDKTHPFLTLVLKKIQKYFEENKYFNITPKASLLHGNFNYDNLLVENGIIHGIVDWEWAKSMHNEEEAGTFFYRILKEDKEFISSFKKGYEKYIKLNKGFNQRYKAYNLLYYLKVLPDVKKWVHRPDKQKEYYEEVNKLYHEVIDKND